MSLEKLLGTGGISPSLTQLNKVFDIVYINYNNGLDDLIRNGEMVRQAIKYIQANPSFLGCDQSYVIGLGMGGVVARIALNKMEMAGESHNVRKLIAVNSPFQGINVPIGLQFSIQHLSEFIRRIEVKMSETIEGFANIQKIANLLDQPAFRQLLMHRINKSFEYDNSEHDNFMLYKIFLAKPENCESVAIATGYMHDNYGDRLFQPYSELLTLYDFEKHYSSDRRPNLPLWIGRGSVDIDIDAKSIPENEVKTIYSGELKFRQKVLVFNIPKRVTLRNSFNSAADMNPIDGTNGCYIPMNLISGNDEFISSLLKVDKFCFLPTYSALDIADEDAYFNGGGINIPFDRYYLDSGSKSYSDNSYMIDYLMKEIMPAVGGDIENILDDTELYVDNVPDISGLPIQFNWNFKNGNFRVVSQDGNKAVVRPLAYGEFDYADTVSVNISVNLPILSIPPMSTPTVRITPHTIRIDGSSYITAGAQTFELDTLPKNAGTVEWTAGENIKVSRQGEKSATAYATEYSEDAWIEASFAVGDDRYNIRKDLIASRLDSVTGMKMEQTWWDKEVAADKYFFKVELYPIYMPPQEIHFCWSNTVRIYDKDGNLKRENDSNDDDDRFPPTMVDPGGLVVDYGFMGNGMAEIETPGDVGICQFAVEYPGGPAIPADSLIFGRGGGYDHLIMPTSTDYPPGEIDPIITIPALTGPNCAIVTMPALGTDLGDYAAGEIRCDISDDYGNRYRVSYYVRSERGVVYHNYSVSPNPTSDQLDVKMKVEGDASMSEPSPMTVKLYGDTGLVREATFDDPVAGGSIDVSNLPEGTYYMNLEINDTVVKRQVVLIQR